LPLKEIAAGKKESIMIRLIPEDAQNLWRFFEIDELSVVERGIGLMVNIQPFCTCNLLYKIFGLCCRACCQEQVDRGKSVFAGCFELFNKSGRDLWAQRLLWVHGDRTLRLCMRGQKLRKRQDKKNLWLCSCENVQRSVDFVILDFRF